MARVVPITIKQAEPNFMNNLCAKCGLSFGSHSVRELLCPAHENYLDWNDGAGTTFESSGHIEILPSGTPAKNLPSQQEKEEE